jgi:hypothetical protein
MLSRFGRRGCDEVLDGATRLCLQLLYERHGAIRFTMLSDHGHNFAATKNVRLAPLLERAGFHVKDRITGTYDVVLELNGLVTYLGIDTLRPRQLCDALLAAPQVEQAIYLEGDHVLIRTRGGSAAVDCRRGAVRYRPISGDPLGYAPVIASMRQRGAIDGDGYATDAAWLAATADHAYPDAPRRLWDAFHRGAVHVPRVMLTLADGFSAGLPSLEKFITMASTHGSLNQDNSAAFVITTSRRLDGARRPLRSGDVLPAVAPEALASTRTGDSQRHDDRPQAPTGEHTRTRKHELTREHAGMGDAR